MNLGHAQIRNLRRMKKVHEANSHAPILSIKPFVANQLKCRDFLFQRIIQLFPLISGSLIHDFPVNSSALMSSSSIKFLSALLQSRNST